MGVGNERRGGQPASSKRSWAVMAVLGACASPGAAAPPLGADGRGGPWLCNLDVAVAPQVADRASGLESLSLASLDADEDGMPDVASGHGGGSAGRVLLRRGNVDALFPNAPDARERRARGTFTDVPFLPEVAAFDLPLRPDFLGSGDFDADGHADLVAASRDDARLAILPGDGRGGFGAPRMVGLPGRATALATGDVNRQDGLEDVVVAVAPPGAPALLIFEGPEGAAAARPESIPLPEAATSIAIGDLAGGPFIDVAAAAGRRVVLLHGRDRELYRSAPRHDQTPRVERLAFASPVRSLAAAWLLGDVRPQIAALREDGRIEVAALTGARPFRLVLSAGPWPGATSIVRTNLSSLASDDLTVLDAPAGRLHVALPYRDLARAGRGVPIDQRFREELDGADPSVSFDVAGTPAALLPMQINLESSLDPVLLLRDSSAPVVARSRARAAFVVNFLGDANDLVAGDALCDVTNSLPGSQCTLRALIQETNALAGSDSATFTVASVAPNSALPTITGSLTLDGSGVGRFEIDGSGAGAANGIQSTAVLTMNAFVINGFSGDGVNASNTLNLTGSYIGTDVGGAVDVGMGDAGVECTAGGGIGGTTVAARNVISGNGRGIRASGTITIRGNYVGLAADGSTALGNANEGISQDNVSTSTTVGSTAAGGTNVISANLGTGIVTDGTCLVVNNLVGTDAAGAADRGNGGDAVLGSFLGVLTVGSTSSSGRNVLAGNDGAGVFLIGGGSEVVVGNYIGTNLAGSAVLANASGIIMAANPDVVIGGISAGARNVISGNTGNGISLSGPRGEVRGNYIGTDASGMLDLGNGNGLTVSGTRCQIGGGSAAARNVVSGNVTGIACSGTENRIEGNYVGTAADGTTALGNSGTGIAITACCNIVGGSLGGGNVLAFNGSDGVAVTGSGSDGNLISMNRTFSNGNLGIDLDTTGVLPNDAGDADSGANEGQNFPVITAVTRTTGTLVEGTLDSLASRSYDLELFTSTSCDASGNGEGQVYAGSAIVATDAGGNASWAVMLPTILPAGSRVTATATDEDQNTSELSACGTAFSPPGTPGVLTVAKGGPGLDLDWAGVAGNCGGNDYAVHQGTLASLGGGAYDHAAVTCTTGGAVTHGMAVPSGDVYFLINANTPAKEGSYGQDSGGLERPASTGPCKPVTLLGCP